MICDSWAGAHRGVSRSGLWDRVGDAPVRRRAASNFAQAYPHFGAGCWCEACRVATK